ncbi:hypothetical protein [Streptomyces sp. AM 2-1-1]|uniref:hypothetical protein n=1 Tax=Streptomyces sp. AM 2-1-1 TaxID=3028709 RepID=UPI0023B92C2D|nr:hypothetical protein [Streptomyces sp. AM 2-1-1]WEH41086.1 hypothetical protein PZB77_17140 [Streptomyces sp. AM 2-1-1]
MRAAFVRRSALVASAASLALLVTACGGSSDDTDTKGKAEDAPKSASAEPEQSAVEALTAAELEKASLVAADLPKYQVKKADAADVLKAGAVTTDKPECLPLAEALFGVAQGKPAASTMNQVMQVPDAEPVDQSAGTSEEDVDKALESLEDTLGSIKEMQSTMVGLFSYDGKGSADALAAVRESATACTSGFSATAEGETQKFSEITEGKATGGDEAVSWSLLATQEGVKVPFELLAVRHAGTVATFSTFNMSGMSGGAVAKVEQPTEVVDAQVKKLS